MYIMRDVLWNHSTNDRDINTTQEQSLKGYWSQEYEVSETNVVARVRESGLMIGHRLMANQSGIANAYCQS